MTELSQARAAATEQEHPETGASAGFDRVNKRVQDLLFGTQRAMFEETLFLGNEILDRTKTETHLFAEFASKMGSAHSVKDIRTMYQECGQHQIDFIRRDCERLFRHGERMIQTASSLFSR